MIAIDTNILVYAHREDAPWHDAAVNAVRRVAEGRAAWCIPWPCVHEFLAIVTHPRIFKTPTPLKDALDQVEAWLESPSVVVVGETEGYWHRLREALEAGRIAGALVHDGRVAAICLHHGVSMLWTADRDFGRFASLKSTNPLVR